MLTRTQQLTKTSLEHLQLLLESCQQQDGSIIPVYPHLLIEHRAGPASLLYYDEDKLRAFLAVFHFHPDTCEMALLVDPAYRRQGLATALWGTMLPRIQTILPSVKHVIISTPSSLNQVQLEQHAFCFQHSEYDMACLNNTPSSIPNVPLTIRPADHTDIPSLCLIDKACFNPNRPNAALRFENTLNNPNVRLFVASHGHQIMGQVHLTLEKTGARLTDLAVLPAQQQQGFGQALVVHCLNYTHKHHQHRVTLVVAAQNKHALQLYQNLGFKIYNAVDYYKKTL